MFRTIATNASATSDSSASGASSACSDSSARSASSACRDSFGTNLACVPRYLSKSVVWPWIMILFDLLERVEVER